MGTISRLDLAANWSDAERHTLYDNRGQFLLALDEESDLLPIGSLETDPDLLSAALSLAQDGHVRLEPENPEVVRFVGTANKSAAEVNQSGDGDLQLQLDKEKLAKDFDDESKLIQIRRIVSPRIVRAALSLAQDGHVILDSNNPSFIRLTQSGERFARSDTTVTN